MTGRHDPVRIGLLVFLVLVIVFVLLPILFVFLYAFSSVPYAGFPPPGYSFRWFVKLLEQGDLGHAAINSTIIAGTVTVLSLAFGTMASVVLVRYRFRQRELLRTLFLSPLVVPRIAFGVGMLVYFVLLRRYGGLDSLILAHLVLTLPFTISVISASLVNVDRAVEEAAMDLGATAFGAFWRATLPQLRTALAVSAFFAFIVSWTACAAAMIGCRPAVGGGDKGVEVVEAPGRIVFGGVVDAAVRLLPHLVELMDSIASIGIVG